MKKKINSVNGGTCNICGEKNVNAVGMNIHKCDWGFCKYCGAKLVEQEPISADHFGGLSFYIPQPYDEKTGRIKMRRWVACPNKNKFWEKVKGNSVWHISHAIGEAYYA